MKNRIFCLIILNYDVMIYMYIEIGQSVRKETPNAIDTVQFIFPHSYTITQIDNIAVALKLLVTDDVKI